MKDSHVHTNISHDGISTINEYIAHAKNIGVDEITFTEHYDDYSDIETNLKTLMVLSYYQEYFCKQREDRYFKTNFGIEFGLQPNEKLKEKINDMTRYYPFDFIIGSSHITCKKDIAMDSSFFDGLSRKEAYMKYFLEVLENIKLYDEFDVYGHLDYIVRYGGYDLKSIDYHEFQEILDEILINLIKKDKGIELNTSGIRYSLDSFHPNVDILKRYKELGGKIITLGSDAHKTDDLASNFKMAYQLLESVGFELIATYHNRVPDFTKIKSLKLN